jgi:hypothetical protein
LFKQQGFMVFIPIYKGENMSSYIQLNEPNVHLLGDCTTIFIVEDTAFVNVNVDFDENVTLKTKKNLFYKGESELTHKKQVEQIQINLMKQITMLQNAVIELDQIRRTDSIL